jgi:putative RNA 2'-phosphotransferase
MVKLSKFLSLVLRHKPQVLGLSLSPSGWAQVDDLLAAARAKGFEINEDLLRRIVGEDAKTRYSLSEDRRQIRANYGHSIEIDLALEAGEPPEFLYHGTATKSLDSIKRHGIASQRRRFVHLSVDTRTATVVARRHGKPAILTVEARRMHDQGFTFYYSESDIWLTERVPPEYIAFDRLLIEG